MIRASSLPVAFRAVIAALLALAVPALAPLARAGAASEEVVKADAGRYAIDVGPALSRRMHEAFVGAGGRAKFVLAPAFRTDGHALFARGTAQWLPEVDAFLGSLGFGGGRLGP